MADSRSSVGASPGASTSVCWVSFQLSFVIRIAAFPPCSSRTGIEKRVGHAEVAQRRPNPADKNIGEPGVGWSDDETANHDIFAAIHEATSADVSGRGASRSLTKARSRER